MSDGVEKTTSKGSRILQTHMDVMARFVLARSDEIVWLGDKSVIDPRKLAVDAEYHCWFDMRDSFCLGFK
jgi:hypothetical protein